MAASQTAAATGDPTVPRQDHEPGPSRADAGPAPAPLVAVRDLHVTFRRRGGGVHALRGVDLDMRPGEIVGLVGESGSGKSVLAMTLLGLHPTGNRAPSVSGTASISGLDMVAASPELRREVRKSSLGAVFQDPMTSLDPTMKVGRQVVESAGSKEHALRLMEQVGIPDPERRMGQFPHELSGGLRQRIMIAMAIGGSPSLVFADEPTTALDVTVQAQILDLIRRLRDESGTSFLFTTHDLAVAAEVADRLVVMYAGRVMESGPTYDVLNHPAHPYTAGLLASRISLNAPRERQLPIIAGDGPTTGVEPPGCPFAPRCPHHTDVCDAALPEPVAAATHEGVVACVRADEIVAPGRTYETVPWPAAVARRAAYSLELADVDAGYGRGRKRSPILKDVSLRVRPGEGVAIVGESGSGKSTLLRVAAGLLTPTKGDVAVAPGGRPQIVFQDPGASMTPWMSIGELVGEPLRATGATAAQRSARVAEVLKLVGLPVEVSHVKPGQLSGGQRQRAAIARAIAVVPSVLLCDEPTSALDVSLAAGVLNLIGRLRRELGMALVFVTHDLAAARIVSDRILVMTGGVVVEELDSSAPLEESAHHEYTRTLLAAAPRITDATEEREA